MTGSDTLVCHRKKYKKPLNMSVFYEVHVDCDGRHFNSGKNI
jgi:hypothetical protein